MNCKNIKILLITEASVQTGYGHLSRCISLYHAFKERNLIPQIIINADNTIKKIIGNRNYKVFNWLEEKERLFELLIGKDITILDSYLADYLIYKEISQNVKIPVFIDDYFRLDYPPGVIINTSFPKIISNELYKENTIYLLGTEYCMLKKEFWDVHIIQFNNKLKNILTTFGGSDERNLTPKILNKINKVFPNLKKTIIIGKGFQNISEIEKICNENCELIYFPTAKAMKSVMMNSDIAITAGGQTIYELAAVGVPAITIAVDNNQINSAKLCAKLGLNYYAGWWSNSNLLENILNYVVELQDIKKRKEMIKLGKKYIIADGSRRIVNYLLNLLLEKNEK